MSKYGLLVDYEYCTGCYACIVACRQERNLPAEKSGLHLVEIGAEVVGFPKLYNFVFPTDDCTLCTHRAEKSLKPFCVTVCPAGALKSGTIEELAEYMRKKPKTLLWVPR